MATPIAPVRRRRRTARVIDGEEFMPIASPVYGAGSRQLQESPVGVGMLSSGMTTGGAIGSGVMRGRMPASVPQVAARMPGGGGLIGSPGGGAAAPASEEAFQEEWNRRFRPWKVKPVEFNAADYPGYSPVMASGAMMPAMAMGAKPFSAGAAADAAMGVRAGFADATVGAAAGAVRNPVAPVSRTPVQPSPAPVGGWPASMGARPIVQPTGQIAAPVEQAAAVTAAGTSAAPVLPVSPGMIRRAAPYAITGVGGALIGGVASSAGDQVVAPLPPAPPGTQNQYYSRPYSRQNGGLTSDPVIAMNRARSEAAMGRMAGTGKAPDYWQKAIPNLEARRFFGRNPGALTDATLEAMRVGGGQNMRNDGAYEAYSMAVANEGLTRRQQMMDLMGQFNATEDPAQRAVIKAEYDAIASAPSSVQAPVMPQQPTYADVQRGIMGGGGRPASPVPMPTIVNMPGGAAVSGQPVGPTGTPADESHMNDLVGDMERSGDPEQQQIARRYRETQKKLDAAQQRVTQLDRLAILRDVMTLGIPRGVQYARDWLSGK